MAVERYCERHGVEPLECRGVLISSLTKAAAAELRGRGLEIHPDQVRTLHAHAFHSLGKPALCIEPKRIQEWNEAYPRYRLSGGTESADTLAGYSNKAPGDKRLARYHVYRARLTDRELWSADVAEFAEVYETWKRVNHYLDFSDVIHEAWKTVDVAPGNPEIIFVDEAQDHDRAELRLVRKWAEKCEKLIIVGDPDQNLYEWRGSEPQAFYEAEVPPENHRVLSQSYRVPRAVHATAVEMIERCKDRVPQNYTSRNFSGEVIRRGVPLIDPRFVGEMLTDAAKYLTAGKTVMFLASCDYMLRPLCAELKARGTPFWNPFAAERTQFNPLHPSRGVSATQRLLTFLRPNADIFPDYRMWTYGEFAQWTEVCGVEGLLRRGAGKWIEEQVSIDEEAVMTSDALRYACVSDEVVCELLEPSPRFFLSKVKPDRRKPIEYAVKVFENHGMDGLRHEPQTVVGTVHSVKGGEADVVYLAPDLSPEGWERFDNGKRDPIYRLMYVGMTRAKETLILCEPKTSMSVEW